MRVVSSEVKLVPMSGIRGGETFRWNYEFWIRTSKSAREDHNIGGIDLENGRCVADSDSTMVELVQMEAREL